MYPVYEEVVRGIFSSVNLHRRLRQQKRLYIFRTQNNLREVIMSHYTSIKEDVLRKLDSCYSELRERFGVDTIGIFGSVSRGEDTADSDVDVLIAFQEGKVSFSSFIHLADYLEELFGRRVDLLTKDGMSPYMRPYIEAEVISVEA